MNETPSITGLEFGKKVAEAFRKGLGEKEESNGSLNMECGKIEAENLESNIAIDYDYTGLRVTPFEANPEIIVFTSSGKTYNFKNIENLTPTTQGFEFDYTGVATGVKRHASFNYTSVAGYALA